MADEKGGKLRLGPSVSKASEVKGGVYLIVNAWHSAPLCLDKIEEGDLKKNQPLQIYRPDHHEGLRHDWFMKDDRHPEYWKLVPSGEEGEFYVYNPSARRYIKRPDGGMKVNSDVWVKDSGENQVVWCRPVDGMGYFHIIPGKRHSRESNKYALALRDLKNSDSWIVWHDRLPGADRGWFLIPLDTSDWYQDDSGEGDGWER